MATTASWPGPAVSHAADPSSTPDAATTADIILPNSPASASASASLSPPDDRDKAGGTRPRSTPNASSLHEVLRGDKTTSLSLNTLDIVNLPSEEFTSTSTPSSTFWDSLPSPTSASTSLASPISSVVSPRNAALSPVADPCYQDQEISHTEKHCLPLNPSPSISRIEPTRGAESGETVHKILASVTRNNKPGALSFDGMASSQHHGGGAANTNQLHEDQHRIKQDRPNNMAASTAAATTSKRLTDALNDLVLSAAPETPTTAFPMLSPCFYHQRFNDTVNIDKVLEEIKNDMAMSHSRLVQTATSVREVSRQLQRRPVRRAVRSVMIITKARDNQLVHLTRELTSWLLETPRYGSDLGVVVYVDAQLRNSKRFNAQGILDQNPRYEHMLKYWTPDLCWNQPGKFDLVLTLGGDGTVLFTSWLFQRVVPPVLSFSLGSLGFLTTFEFERYKDHLNRVMGDDGMKINLRMRFTCTVWRAGASRPSEQFEVLNELVIDRGPSPYVSNLELYGDDDLLTVVQADGCIFSTPTGSTAYSLSAGGALVHPDIPAILLTPICPHTLSFRPMILSDTTALRVVVPRSSRATAYCAFDGKSRVELRQGDYVTIAASQYPFPTVTRSDAEWFDSVSRTLRWNTRAAAQKPFDNGALGASDECSNDFDSDAWDIDTDSGFYASEDGSMSASPMRRQMLEM